MLFLPGNLYIFDAAKQIPQGLRGDLLLSNDHSDARRTNTVSAGFADISTHKYASKLKRALNVKREKTRVGKATAKQEEGQRKPLRSTVAQLP